jgi:hypothetical protein
MNEKKMNKKKRAKVTLGKGQSEEAKLKYERATSFFPWTS